MGENFFQPTAQQKRFAQLLVEGELSKVEAYTIAYNPSEKLKANKQQIATVAYSTAKSKGVRYWIQKLQEEQAIQEATTLVWDKRKASTRLLKLCHEIEVNVDITRRLRDDMLNDKALQSPAKLSQMLKVSQICNDTARTIKECIVEMNQMYGLTNPEVSLTNAVQVVIKSSDALPEDTEDNSTSQTIDVQLQEEGSEDTK